MESPGKTAQVPRKKRNRDAHRLSQSRAACNCATSRCVSLRARRRSSRSTGPSSCWARSTRSGPTPTSTSAIASPITGRSRIRNLKLTGDEAQPRPAAVRRGRVGRGRRAGRSGRRAGADRRRAEQACSTSRPRRSRRWRQQGLVSRRFMFDGRKRVGFLQSSVDRFVAAQRRARAPRRALQPAHRRRAERDHRAGPPAGARRRLPGRGRPADRPAHEPQRRDDSLHAQAVRPGASRPGGLSRAVRAA